MSRDWRAKLRNGDEMPLTPRECCLVFGFGIKSTNEAERSLIDWKMA